MALIFSCSIDSAAKALHLKKYGTEYHGACPICGGKDRFWIKQASDGIAVHCRRGCEFKDLAHELRQRGIAVKDDYAPNAPKRVYMWETDRIYVDVFLMMYRNGERLSERDRGAIRARINRVDPFRQKQIRKLLEETK